MHGQRGRRRGRQEDGEALPQPGLSPGRCPAHRNGAGSPAPSRTISA
ncbi:hypothetical protein [Ornithinimicrobium kibberense]